MSLTLGLHAAISGLTAAQKGIDLTSNNISNVNTEGYTRKIFRQENVVVDGRGAGVQSQKYTRSVDESLLRDIRREKAALGQLGIRSDFLDRIQDLFGEPAAKNSLAHSLGELQTAFEELSVSSDVGTSHSLVVNRAVATTEKLNSLSDYIQNLRLEADIGLARETEEINEILDRVDRLNEDIARVENVDTSSSGDLRDQRDFALERLAEKVDVQIFERDSGEVVILTASGRALLDKEPVDVSHNRASQTSAWLTYSGGSIPGIYAGRHDITDEIKSGLMRGYVEIRDEIMPELQAEVDQLAKELMEETNAIHNRGTNYPNLPYNVTGARNFIDYSTDAGTTAAQQISISDGDVRIGIFNEFGEEVSSASLGDDLGFTAGIIHDDSTHPAAGTMTAAIETWLQSASPAGPGLSNATVGMTIEGKLNINLGDSGYGIAFRDEATITPGSEHIDVTIDFDANGDGTNDRTYSGFSNFFGLNNFYNLPRQEWIHDSNIVDLDFNANLPVNTTLSFSDKSNGLDFHTVDVYTNDTLETLVNRINNDPTLEDTIQAQLVKEGPGYRLRFISIEGAQLEVTEGTTVPQTTFLKSLGMEPSSAGLSTSIEVRREIERSPGKINRGSMLFDSNSGEYFVSAADNTIVNEMAEMFAGAVNFESAGSLASEDIPLSSYAAQIIGHASSLAKQTEDFYDYQADLTLSLQTKSAEVSGVNLDEEMAQLMIFQQAYAAAAKVVSTTQTMLDILNNLVG